MKDAAGLIRPVLRISAMLHHALWIILIGSLMLLSGCGGAARRDASAPVVAVLSEADFDQFATRIADRLPVALRNHTTIEPVAIAAPEITNTIEDRAAAEELAERLIDGLNDRLAGAAFLGGASELSDYRARLELAHAAPGTRIVTFRVLAHDERQEVLRESMTYRPADATSRPPPAPITSAASAPPPESHRVAMGKAPAGRSPGDPADDADVRRQQPPSAPLPRRQPAPPRELPPAVAEQTAEPGRAPEKTATRRDEPRRSIRINREEDGFAEFLLGQLRHYRASIFSGTRGVILFIDDRLPDRVRMLSHRSSITETGLLRVEVRMRAEKKSRTVEARAVFMDAQNRQTEVTPIVERRFTVGVRDRLLFTATNPASRRYVLLLDD